MKRHSRCSIHQCCKRCNSMRYRASTFQQDSQCMQWSQRGMRWHRIRLGMSCSSLLPPNRSMFHLRNRNMLYSKIQSHRCTFPCHTSGTSNCHVKCQGINRSNSRSLHQCNWQVCCHMWVGQCHNLLSNPTQQALALHFQWHWSCAGP